MALHFHISPGPLKTAIESAVLEILASVADPWDVRIEPAQVAAWWLVTMRRPGDAYPSIFFVDPEERTVEFIVGAVRQVLEEAR